MGYQRRWWLAWVLALFAGAALHDGHWTGYVLIIVSMLVILIGKEKP